MPFASTSRRRNAIAHAAALVLAVITMAAFQHWSEARQGQPASGQPDPERQAGLIYEEFGGTFVVSGLCALIGAIIPALGTE